MMAQEDLEVKEEEGSKMEIDVKNKHGNELVLIIRDSDVSFCQCYTPDLHHGSSEVSYRRRKHN